MSKIIALRYAVVPVLNEVVSSQQGEIHGGVYMRLFFKNGYGVSIVNHSFSYGLEMAVITGTPDGWELNYETEVTSDVLGNLTIPELSAAVKRVSEL